MLILFLADRLIELFMNHKAANSLSSAITFRAIMLVVVAIFSGTLIQKSEAQDIPRVKKQRPAKISNPAVIELNGEINYQMADYIDSRIRAAKAAGVDFLILHVDSPGGLKTESLNIAEDFRDIDWAYTVAYVPREAISGGALITLGFDELVVSRQARLGDIGIIAFDPEQFAFRFAPAKIQSVLVRQARDLASAKGRPPELTESMIDKDVQVYSRPKADGKGFEFKLTRVDSPDQPEAPWTLIEESGPERFLTINGSRAHELGVAQTIAEDMPAFNKEFGLEASKIKYFKRTATDSIVYWLNSPFITGLLVVIGFIALYVELSAPGIGVGGMVAGLCAALFFRSRFLGGTSTWLEIVLFLAGMTFLAMELFVIPGWGVSGLLGLALMFGSHVMAGQDFVVPSSNQQWNHFLTSVLMLMCSGVIVFIAGVFITKKMGHLPMLNRMILAPQPDDNQKVKVAVGDKPAPALHPSISVGDWGKSESLLRPAGRASFGGRSFDVVSDGAFIDPDRQVKVLAIHGNRIVVAEIEDDDTVHHSKNA